MHCVSGAFEDSKIKKLDGLKRGFRNGENVLRTGVRIQDKIDGAISVGLKDILVEIQEGNAIKWSILFLAGLGLYRGKSIPDLELDFRDFPKGMLTSWDDLKFLIEIDNRVEDLVLIGCRNDDALKKYDNDQEMYECCD